MKSAILLLAALVAASARAGGDGQAGVYCTPEWYALVERRLGSGDGQGHGPDPGSEEWKGVVEFRLGIRGQPDLPARDTDAWCVYIDERMRARSE